MHSPERNQSLSLRGVQDITSNQVDQISTSWERKKENITNAQRMKAGRSVGKKPQIT